MGVAVEVEAVARHPDDRLHVAHLPPEVGDGHLALGGQHHVAVPLPGVAGGDLGEAPVVEVRQRVHRQLVHRAVLGAGARHREGVRRHGELVGTARLLGGLASDVGGAVGGAVVDQQHVVAGAQQRRQHERQRRRLVLDPQHRGGAGVQLARGPGPDDVVVGVALEVADAGRAGVGGHRCAARHPAQRPAGLGRHHRAQAVRHLVGGPRCVAAGPGLRRTALDGALGRAARRRPPTSARWPPTRRRGRRTPRAAGRAPRAPRGCRRRGRRAC